MNTTHPGATAALAPDDRDWLAGYLVRQSRMMQTAPLRAKRSGDAHQAGELLALSQRLYRCAYVLQHSIATHRTQVKEIAI